jgi:ENTS family enterobactin (siderophore) exporter
MCSTQVRRVWASWAARFDRLGLVQLGSMMLFALSLAAVGVSGNLVVALPFIVLAGIGEMVGLTANQTLMQVAAPSTLRGRMTSLIAMNPSFISLGSMLVGVGAQWLGASGITLLLAGIGALFCVAMTLGSAGLREMRLSQYKHEPAHHPPGA